MSSARHPDAARTTAVTVFRGTDEAWVTDKGPHERQDMPAAPQTPQCTSCKRAKVRCRESLPCARCFKHCLPCVPAPRGSTYPELAVSVMDIAAANNTFMKIFAEMHKARLLDRARIRTLLSAWHAESERAGTDITHGLLRNITRATKLSDAELATYLDVGIAKCGDARRSYVSATKSLCCTGRTMGFNVGRELRSEKGEEVCERASQEAALRTRLRDCAQIHAMDDGTRMVVAIAPTRQGLVVATNSVADDLFCSATEMMALLHQHRVLPLHVIASMISSADWHLLFEAQLSMLCSQPRPYTGFVKLCERDGQIELYIMQARVMQMPEVSEASSCVSLFTLERCPASRHLTTRPGHRHRIIERYRQRPKALGSHMTQPLQKPIHELINDVLPVTTAESSIHEDIPDSSLVPELMPYNIGLRKHRPHDMHISSRERVCAPDVHMSADIRPFHHGCSSSLSGTSAASGLQIHMATRSNGPGGEGDGYEDDWLEEVSACLGHPSTEDIRDSTRSCSSRGRPHMNTMVMAMTAAHNHRDADGLLCSRAHTISDGAVFTAAAHIDKDEDLSGWLRLDRVPLPSLVAEFNCRHSDVRGVCL